MNDLKPADALKHHPPLGPPAPPPAAAHLGWYSRGYLPHCDGAQIVQHIVFGLADAMPPGTSPPSALHGDRVLDTGRGECLLRSAACARMVENCLLQDDGRRYRLIAWCVMPNHAHILVEQVDGFRLGDIVQTWKSVSAHKINQHRRGRVWRREYFDRFMRDDAHLATTIQYIENNPVNAGLAAQAQHWTWSSARRRIDSAGEGAGGPR